MFSHCKHTLAPILKQTKFAIFKKHVSKREAALHRREGTELAFATEPPIEMTIRSVLRFTGRVGMLATA